MPRSRPLTLGPARSGLIPGGSDHLKRYRILRRRQKRLDSNRRGEPEEESSNSDHSLETDPDAEIQKVVNHVRSFANELYLPLREKHTVNLVYSPLGFCVSSTMLSMGCQGLGKEELIHALFAEDSGATGDGKKMGCDDACSEMIIGIAALLNCIKDDSDSVSFKHDYKMFLDRHHKPKQSYLTRLKSLYHAAGMEEIDLSDDNREQAFKKINQWAHSAGSKQLGDMLTKRTVGNKIIFVNPLYFMGNWVYPFNPALTQEMQFFINETETGERLALVIFLPNRNGGLPIIESGLESLSPAEYFKDMHKFRRKLASDSRFQVYLPRLRIDCTIDLESPLKEMGVETIFHSGKADFSGLAHISPKELSISQILQKVVIDINETGTAEQPGHFRNQSEAMELTKASGCGDGDDPGPEIIEFRVDHSFYFQIVDMKSDLIVFAGACKNPLQGKELGFKEFLEKYDIPVPPKKLSSDGENIEIPPHILNNTNKC